MHPPRLCVNLRNTLHLPRNLTNLSPWMSSAPAQGLRALLPQANHRPCIVPRPHGCAMSRSQSTTTTPTTKTTRAYSDCGSSCEPVCDPGSALRERSPDSCSEDDGDPHSHTCHVSPPRPPFIVSLLTHKRRTHPDVSPVDVDTL